MAAVRLHRVMSEYEGRVTLRVRPYPFELFGRPGVPRALLEQEWWLAAIQEPAAVFAPFQGDDFPTTTLPAFEAAWSAARQGHGAALAFDLAVRRALFAEGRDIGRREVLLDIAKQMGLDTAAMVRDLDGGAAGAAVAAEAREGRERWQVRGTPTVMLADGTRLRLPIAFPVIRDMRVVGIGKLPCAGDGCLPQIRELFERALRAPSGP